MTNTILFSEEINGYSKEQVDNYVEKLSKAYRAAYAENQELQEKYKNLEDECKELEVHEKTRLNAGVVAKTMVNLETMAQKIIAEAQVAEAQEGVIAAKAEAKRIVSEANAEADKQKAAAEMIFDEANTERAKAKAEVRRFRDEAQTDAARTMLNARKRAEQANEIMEQTLIQLRDLLAINGTAEDRSLVLREA